MLAVSAAAAESYRLAPYKDELFEYPAVLDSEDDGDFVVVEYLKERDLYGRDEIPERRALPQYVTLTAQHTETTSPSTERTLKFIGVGKIDGGAKVGRHLHPRAGRRPLPGRQRVDVRRQFQPHHEPDGAERRRLPLAGLFRLRRQGHGRDQGADARPGGALARRADLRRLRLAGRGDLLAPRGATPRPRRYLGGLLLLGSNHDDAFLEVAGDHGHGCRFPIYLGHGTRDIGLRLAGRGGLLSRRSRPRRRTIRSSFALFDTGSHGTPIRMTDWRLVLNWMLEVQRQIGGVCSGPATIPCLPSPPL